MTIRDAIDVYDEAEFAHNPGARYSIVFIPGVSDSMGGLNPGEVAELLGSSPPDPHETPGQCRHHADPNERSHPVSALPAGQTGQRGIVGWLGPAADTSQQFEKSSISAFAADAQFSGPAAAAVYTQSP